MIRLGNSGNHSATPGKTLCGKAVQQVSGGYEIQFGDNLQHTGLAVTSDKLAVGKELLFKVVGYRNGQPLLHPVFSGYR
jgi:hypothetical protein